MAKVSVSAKVPVSPDKAWTVVSDLSRLGEWMTMHEAWRGEVPPELTEGTKLTSVVSIKGMRNRVDWTIDKLQPPSELEFSGDGVGGVHSVISLAVQPDGDTSSVSMEIEFSGGPVRGPVGMMVSKALKGEVRRSVDNLAALIH